jgi:ferric-dicitrate binding protein FerR (iron transport regulator)
MKREVDSGTSAAAVERVAEFVRSAIPPMTPAQCESGLDVVRGRLEARHLQRARLLRLSAVGVGAGMAACALWWVFSGSRVLAPQTGSLAYRVEGGEIVDGGYLRSLGNSGVRLRFAEGSELEFIAGARGRLRSVDANGARFAVERGTASVKVAHRPGAHWLVDAGPFLITVQGTTFTVAWDATGEQLDLHMQQGTVSVTGPLSESAITVRAGQRLAINLPKREVVLQDAESAAVLHPAGAPVSHEPEMGPAKQGFDTEPGEAARDAAGPQTGSHARAAGAWPRSWPAALAAGELDSILRDAERRGLARCLAGASGEDLSALADAARYRRRDSLAKQALLTQRSRFPGSARALDSAFLLGRLEEMHEGSRGKALSWYQRYLEEAPSGAYASEALGREMIVTQDLMGVAAAHKIAEDYLRRFPNGTYAGAARALRQGP